MCIDFRHYLFLVPPTAIGAAMVLGNLKKWQEYKFQLLLLLLIPLIFSFQQHAPSFILIYLPSFAILMIFSFFKSNQIKAALFSLLLIGSFLIKPLEMVSNARKNKYPKQVKLIKEQLIEKEDKAVILTDHVQARIGNYLSGFSEKVRFIPYAKVNQAIGENHKFLLINPYTEFFSLLTTDDYPFFVKHAFSEDSIIFESQSPDLKVFRLNRIVAPSFNGELLLESFNKDFKPKKPYWDQKENSVQVDSSSGNSYYKVGEYSATFRYPLDSLKPDSAKNLYFQAELKTKFFDSTEAVLVFDIKSGDDSYFWKGFAVQKFQKTTNHWWTVKFDESIAYSAIKPNSVLSIYLWNVDQKETYIDDFKIKVIAF